MSRKRLLRSIGLALALLTLSAAVVYAAISNVNITFTPGINDANWTANWAFTANSAINTDVCLTMNSSTTSCSGSGNNYTCSRSGLSANTNYSWTLRETVGIGCGLIFFDVATASGNFTISPLAVNLAGFAVATSDGYPALAWETVSEQNNAGFNIYRGATEQGPWVKLNDALIPSAAPGAVEGRAYQFADPTAQPGAHWYMLEDVDLNGVATQHDPAGIELAAPTAVTMQQFEARVDWFARLKALFGR